MSAPKNGQGNNQSGTASTNDLHIPTLGAAASEGHGNQPVLQEGEEPEAQTEPASTAGQNDAATQQRKPTMAELQAAADAAAGKPRQAMHTPVRQRNDVAAEATVPVSTLEIPGLNKGLGTMERPDQTVEPITDIVNFREHAAALAFLEEMVTINIAETGDPNAENPVQLGVNGRQVFIRRGVDTTVRRKYVEMLLRSKPETINTRQVRDGDGDVKNFVDKRRALKYPFYVVQDDNPMGRAWMRKIASEA
jgi:hypothetical protein